MHVRFKCNFLFLAFYQFILIEKWRESTQGLVKFTLKCYANSFPVLSRDLKQWMFFSTVCTQYDELKLSNLIAVTCCNWFSSFFCSANLKILAPALQKLFACWQSGAVVDIREHWCQLVREGGQHWRDEYFALKRSDDCAKNKLLEQKIILKIQFKISQFISAIFCSTRLFPSEFWAEFSPIGGNGAQWVSKEGLVC